MRVLAALCACPGSKATSQWAATHVIAGSASAGDRQRQLAKFRTQFAGCRRKLTAKVSTRVITGRADVSMRNFVELWNLDRPDHRSICEARRLLRLLGSVCQLDAAGLCRCRSVAKPARMVGDQYVPEVGLFTRSWHPWSITCSRRKWRLHMCLSTVMNSRALGACAKWH